MTQLSIDPNPLNQLSVNQTWNYLLINMLWLTYYVMVNILIITSNQVWDLTQTQRSIDDVRKPNNAIQFINYLKVKSHMTISTAKGKVLDKD